MAVAFNPIAVQADAEHRLAELVKAENISRIIIVATDEIAGKGKEGDVLAVAGNIRIITDVIGLAAQHDIDQSCLSRLPVMHENIGHTVGVIAAQIGGKGIEGNVAAIIRNSWSVTVKIGFAPIGSDTHPFGDACLPVMNKNVARLVVVAANQFRGIGGKGNVTAVGRNIWPIAVIIGLVAVAAHADALGHVGFGDGVGGAAVK